MSHPDYSEYLTPEHLAHEERLWGTCGLYQQYGTIANSMIKTYGVRSITEIGCGTGWVPTVLTEGIVYYGIDKNPQCLELAKQKNAANVESGYATFLEFDVRAMPVIQPGFFNGLFPLWSAVDLVMSWAVLKHFGLNEWDAIFTKVLSYGKLAAFTLPVLLEPGAEAFDDGTEFPHVWLPLERVVRVAAAAGHTVVDKGPLTSTTEHWFITQRQ